MFGDGKIMERGKYEDLVQKWWGSKENSPKNNVLILVFKLKTLENM